MLAELEQTRRAVFEIRAEKYRRLSDGTSGRLMLELREGAEREAYFSAFQDLCRGTYAREADIRLLVDAVSPGDLGWFLFHGDSDGLAEAAGVDPELSARVVSIRDNHSVEEILAVQSRTTEDVPDLKLQGEDGEYRELSALSVGQKCAALLMVALSEADRPILVDQPEDALDIASIFLDVASPIRDSKDARQFILTTHNATVAVAGDADTFLIMKGTAESGAVTEQGAIEREEVRREVILHLEGGPKPYQLKAKKYGRDVT